MTSGDDDEPQAVRYKGSPWTGLEAAAVGFLAAGGLLLPVVGPLLPLVLVWLSKRWSTRQKALGSVLAMYPLLLVIVGIALGVDEDTNLGAADWLVVLGFPLSGAVAAIYLSIVLNRSGRQE
jgi:hypothetical protein